MTIKPLLIYNPIAGQGNAQKRLPEVQAILAEKKFEYDLVLTDHPGAAQSLAHQAAINGCPLIIAAGGDGTVNEAINGIMTADLHDQPRPAFAVLPIGRGNDFAFGLGVNNTIATAVDVLIRNQRQLIDIGKVIGGDYPNGRYFGNGVGVGFDTVVGFEAAKITWLHGIASYLVALIRTIFLYAHAPIYELKFDDTTLQQPFLMVSVMNGRRMGGSFMMAPNSKNNDGQFDLCLAGDIAQARILSVASKFISGTQEKDSAVRMERANSVTVTAISGKIPAHADGETICTAGDCLQIEIIPAALQVIHNLTDTVA